MDLGMLMFERRGPGPVLLHLERALCLANHPAVKERCLSTSYMRMLSG